MKRKDLIKKLESAGFRLVRHGANHDIYERDGVLEPVERHKEIPERLAKKILKRNGIEQPPFQALNKGDMKNVYPVFIKKEKKDYLVYLPDVDDYTSGKTFYDAINMARDLLGALSLETKLPSPSDSEKAKRIAEEKADDPDFKFSDADITYVDIDTEEYKKKLDTRSVKKNCTIPAWLNDKAEAAGVNFSRALQDALIKKLS